MHIKVALPSPAIECWSPKIIEKNDNRAVNAAAFTIQQIIDRVSLRIFWKDRDSVFLGCNELFAEDAGVSTSSIVGLTDFDLAWRTEEAQFYQEVDRRVMQNNVAEMNIIEPQRHADGSETWLETTKIPITNADGQVVGIVCCYDEVTERVQNERKHEEYRRHLEDLIETETKARKELQNLIPETQKTDSLRLMAGGIAHDFNNTIGAIMGFGEMLPLIANDPARVNEVSAGIMAACRSAANLCSQLSVFSGNVLDPDDSVDLNQFATEQLPLLKASLQASHTIRFSIPSRPSVCRAPINKLQQIVLNLVCNAADAMDHDGDIVIKTGVEEYSLQRLDSASLNYAESGGPFAFVEVTDTGSGIEDEIVKNIFDPFFSTKSNRHGLGLATVSGIVASQNGAVELDTRVNEGTTFRLLLPAHSRFESNSDAGLSAAKGRSKHIMLVDDNEQFLDASQKLIAAHGYQVTAFNNGLAAISEFEDRRHEIDVVALDVQMPVMNGLQVKERIRQIQSEIPIIFMTGFVKPALRAQLQGSQGVYLLEKPFQISDLTEVIERLPTISN